MLQKLNAMVLALIFCATCLLAQKPNANDPAILDDFNDTFLEDQPNQTNLGAAKGILEKGFAYKGGGWWYTYADPQGSVVLNEKGDTVNEINDNAGTMVDTVKTWLHVKVLTSTSIEEFPYAGFGCLMTGKGNGDYHNLSKMTALKMKLKGSGNLHIRVETKDLEDAGHTWGQYEYLHVLKPDWETLVITPDKLLPPKYSEAWKAGWTFDHGKAAANKVSFQIKDGDDGDVYVDDILLDGMTYGEFTPVIHNAVVKKSVPVYIAGNKITYTLQEKQSVRLAIYDLKGKLVNELVDRNEPAGTHSVLWNGDNSLGSKLGNGVYMCRFNTEAYSANIPLTIVK